MLLSHYFIYLHNTQFQTRRIRIAKCRYWLKTFRRQCDIKMTKCLSRGVSARKCNGQRREVVAAMWCWAGCWPDRSPNITIAAAATAAAAAVTRCAAADTFVAGLRPSDARQGKAAHCLARSSDHRRPVGDCGGVTAWRRDSAAPTIHTTTLLAASSPPSVYRLH